MNGKQNVNIRQAVQADAEMLAQLNSEVQQVHAEARPDIFKPAGDLEPFINDFHGRLLANPDGRMLIIEVEGEPVGYVYAQVSTRPETAYGYGRSSVHIDQIGVKTPHQGQGYGRALIEAVFAMARAQGISRVTLSSWGFNTQAHAFFNKCGFKPYTHNFETFVDQDYSGQD